MWMEYSPMEQWSCKMVAKWVQQKFGADGAPFVEEEISGEILPELTTDELQRFLGVTKLGTRKLIILRVRNFQVRTFHHSFQDYYCIVDHVLNEINKMDIPDPIVVNICSFFFFPRGANSKGFSIQTLKYTFAQSSAYCDDSQGTYERMHDRLNLAKGAGTRSGGLQWIKAEFGHPVELQRITIGDPNGMGGGWGVSYINGKQKLEYYDAYDGQWKMVALIEGLQSRSTKTYEFAPVIATKARLLNESTYCSTGVFICEGRNTNSSSCC